jgi:hypothetical protein
LTSNPAGAILFHRLGPLLNFELASTFALGGTPPSSDSSDRVRIDCGSLLSSIRTDRAEHDAAALRALPSAGTNQRS